LRPTPLDGHGVRLRAWRPGDAAAIAAIRSDPFVARWSALPDEDAEAWIARQHAASFAITVPPDDAPLGKVALVERGARRAELSYWLLPAARGRGLATAACRTLVEAVAGLDAIVLDIDVDNAPSQRIARALGAVRGAEHVEIDRGGVARRLLEFRL
jgi:RimJ/RimL family protein N-acetyltransferase